MSLSGTPMRWPNSWTNPSALDALNGTPIAFLIVEGSTRLDPVRTRARALGIQTAASPPAEVTVLEGSWPGIKRTRNGDETDAGPTGVPWVDSNGWLVRLAKAQHPQQAVWVDTPPTGRQPYALAI